MASIRDLLLAASRMQQQTQTTSPVTPNNGNPAGAYNMLPPQQANGGYDPVHGYSWMQPSPSMDLIRQMLSAPIQQRPVPPMQMVQQAAAPPVTQPIMPAVRQGYGGSEGNGSMSQGQIILPMMNGQQQTLPQLPYRDMGV